jgi:hypothetical protein
MAVATVPLPKKLCGLMFLRSPTKIFKCILKLSYKAEYDGMAIWKKETQWICPPNVHISSIMCLCILRRIGYQNLRCFFMYYTKNHPRLYSNTFKWQALADLDGDALM